MKGVRRLPLRLTHLLFRSLCALSVGCATLPSPALASKIVAEKNCSVRIDEEFQPGQKVFVVRQEGGRSKKVAVVQVSRASRGLSLGKVVQGPKQCAPLKGLSVEEAGGPKHHLGKGGGSAASREFSQPVLDAQAQFLYILFSGKGLEQRTAEPVPSLSLFGLGVRAFAWPGMLANKHSYLAQMFGLGLLYMHGRAVPEIDVMALKDAKNQEPGRQQTIPTTLLAEGAARFPYLGGKLATEARVGYLLHSIKHSLTVAGGLSRAPLRDVSYAGFSLGLTQRIRLLEMLRVNLGFTMPMSMSGYADITSERTADRSAAYDGPLKAATGLMADASVDGIVSKFKVTAGVTYQSFEAKIDLADAAGEVRLAENYIVFFMGVGVFL